MGFSDDQQATLVSPRLAVTAPHASAGDRPENMVMSFYGQQYRVIHSIDRPGLRVTSGDLRLFVLDRDVVHPDGKNPCLPVATQNHLIGPMDGYPNGVITHSLSHSPNVKLKNQNARGNGYHSILYGRVHVSFASAGRNDSDVPMHDSLNVLTSKTITDKDMMVPIGGDSGSPLYVSLKNGSNAIWGVMSGVDPSGQGTYAAYTSLSVNIGWLQNKEQALINRGLLPQNVVRITTAAQDEWEIQSQCLTLPVEFDPQLYLALHPDIQIASQNMLNTSATAFATTHYVNHGRMEKRMWRLPSSFNAFAYLAYNPDLDQPLKDLSDEQKSLFLTHHFARFGRHEGRSFSFPDSDFDPLTYLTLNPDVAEAAYQTPHPFSFAKTHFISCGIREKRAFIDERFKDFDPEVFLALNPDVAQIAGTQPNPLTFARWYFSLFALKEGRSCKIPLPQDFDPVRYRALHGDIDVHLICNPDLDPITFAKTHYQTRGAALEGRIYR
ncbi:MAG: hypothetical protein H2057_05415 [Alphaproteobacteria bacterium]|nr:hypothetical protein [Alphaproteobacteria bacterium]